MNDPELEGFDWDAPDAREKWGEFRVEILASFRKLPREVLEEMNAGANFEADRAVAMFLRAVDSMKLWREIAEAYKAEANRLALASALRKQIEDLREEQARRDSLAIDSYSRQVMSGRVRGAANRRDSEKKARDARQRAAELLRALRPEQVEWQVLSQLQTEGFGGIDDTIKKYLEPWGCEEVEPGFWRKNKKS